MAKRAVDFLIKMSGPRQHCEIDFFGGEPLLNWDVVKQTVEYIESIQEKHNKIFKLTLTTNGMLLTQDKIDYVNEHKMSLVLSLDGRESVHNAMRPVAGSGAESYKYIAKKSYQCCKNNAMALNTTYVVRIHIKTLDFTKDVMAMSDLGFEHLSMEPVVGEEGDYVLREEDWPALEKEYEKLADIYLERQLEGWGEKFTSSTSVWICTAVHVWLNASWLWCWVTNIWQLFQMAIFTHVINS